MSKFRLARLLMIPVALFAINACQTITEEGIDYSKDEALKNLASVAKEAEQAALENKLFMGRPVYLRGEMNDYAVQQPYKLRQFDENTYCTVAPLRSDWSPYRFKFADKQWLEGTNFGYAYPPAVIREGSGDMKLNPFSRFEELKFELEQDGLYRFCIVYHGDVPYVRVTRLEEGKLTTMDEVIQLELQREFSVQK